MTRNDPTPALDNRAFRDDRPRFRVSVPLRLVVRELSASALIMQNWRTALWLRGRWIRLQFEGFEVDAKVNGEFGSYKLRDFK